MDNILNEVRHEDYLNKGRAFALACLKVYEKRTRPKSLEYSYYRYLEKLDGELAEHLFEDHSFELNRAIEQVHVKGIANPTSLRTRERPLYACANIVLEDRAGYAGLGKRTDELLTQFCPRR